MVNKSIKIIKILGLGGYCSTVESVELHKVHVCFNSKVKVHFVHNPSRNQISKFKGFFSNVQTSRTSQKEIVKKHYVTWSESGCPAGTCVGCTGP